MKIIHFIATIVAPSTFPWAHYKHGKKSIFCPPDWSSLLLNPYKVSFTKDWKRQNVTPAVMADGWWFSFMGNNLFYWLWRACMLTKKVAKISFTENDPYLIAEPPQHSLFCFRTDVLFGSHMHIFPPPPEHFKIQTCTLWKKTDLFCVHVISSFVTAGIGSSTLVTLNRTEVGIEND